MPRRALGLFAVSLFLLFSFVCLNMPPLSLADPEYDLEFLESELVLTPNITDSNRITSTVTLVNKGSHVGNLTFRAILEKEDDTPYEGSLALEMGPKCADDPTSLCIGGYTSEQFELQGSLSVFSETLTGYLVVQAGESVATKPLSMTLTFEEEPPPSKVFGLLAVYPSQVISIGAVVGLVVVLSAAALSGAEHLAWFDDVISAYLGPITWDLGENLLASATGVGALLSTITGWTTLETTKYFADMEQYTLLSGFFLFLIALAPLVGKIGATIFPEPGSEESARVPLFLLAVGLVMWAVTGQLLTIHIFLEELRMASTFTSTVVSLLQFMMLLLGLAALVYAAVKTSNYIRASIITRKALAAIGSLQLCVAEATKNASLTPSQIAAQLKGCIATINGHEWLFAGITGTLGETVQGAIDTLSNYLSDESCSSEKAKALLAAMSKGLVDVAKGLAGDEKISLPEAVATLHQLLETANAAEPTRTKLERIDTEVLEAGAEIKRAIAARRPLPVYLP